MKSIKNYRKNPIDKINGKTNKNGKTRMKNHEKTVKESE